MYRIFDVAIATDFEIAELPEIADAQSVPITVRQNRENLPEPGKWQHHWLDPDGKADISLASLAGRFLLRFPGIADFLIDIGDQLVEYQLKPGIPKVTLRHLLLDQVLPRYLGHQGALLLHASGVTLPDVGTVLFSGPSGVGKSTLAAALVNRGASLIADDCVMLRVAEQTPQVIASYHGLRLFDDSISASHGQTGDLVNHYSSKRHFQPAAGADLTTPSANNPNLNAICLLLPGDEVAIDRSCRGEDLVALISQTFQLDVTDRVQQATQFQNLSQVIAGTPLYRVSYPHDHQQLPALISRLVSTLSGP